MIQAVKSIAESAGKVYEGKTTMAKLQSIGFETDEKKFKVMFEIACVLKSLEAKRERVPKLDVNMALRYVIDASNFSHNRQVVSHKLSVAYSIIESYFEEKNEPIDPASLKKYLAKKCPFHEIFGVKNSKNEDGNAPKTVIGQSGTEYVIDTASMLSYKKNQIEDIIAGLTMIAEPGSEFDTLIKRVKSEKEAFLAEFNNNPRVLDIAVIRMYFFPEEKNKLKKLIEKKQEENASDENASESNNSI